MAEDDDPHQQPQDDDSDDYYAGISADERWAIELRLRTDQIIADGQRGLEDLEAARQWQPSVPAPAPIVRLVPPDAPHITSTTYDELLEPGPYLDWPDFWAHERPDQEWLIDQILAYGRGHAFYATKKTGKSLLILALTASLITQTDNTTAIYLDYEMTEDDIYERLFDMGYGPDTNLDRLRYALLPSIPPLDTLAGGQALHELVDREQARNPTHHILVIIDTTTRAVAGDENNADTIRAFYRHTGMGLKQRGCTWARIDHAGKDTSKGQRGSSAKGDDVDIIWKLTEADDGYILHREATRMGWVPERVPIRRYNDPLTFHTTLAVWPAGTKETAGWLDDLEIPVDTTVRNAATKLRAAGQLATQAVIGAAVKYRKLGH